MKHLIIILLFGITFQIYSQNCVPKDISTNYVAPINSERPALKNNFNWQAPNIPLVSNNILNISSGTIKNPYWDASVQQARLDFAYDDKSDFYNEDGWELIRYENGYKQNGSQVNNADIVPMFVLYNRYKGTMRILVNPGYNDDFIKGVVVEIEILKHMNNDKNNPIIPYINASANFGYMSNPSSTLGDTADVTKFYVPCKWYGNKRFAIAEFPIAYDPCVCNNNVYFNFKFKGLKSSTIELSGRFIGQSQSLLDNNGNWIRDWLPAVWEDGLNKNSGMLTFNQTKGFLDMYAAKAKELEKWNATNGIFSDVFKKIMTLGFDKIGGKLASNILGNFAKDLVALNGSKPFINKYDSADYVKLGKSAINMGGDFFTSYLGEKMFGTKPVLPASPHVLWGEIALSGKLLDTSERFEAEFRIPAPGSLDAVKRHEIKNTGITDTGVASYPLYNERLGIFNLLNKPKLYYQDLPSYTPGFYNKRFMYFDDINIALNPKLDIKEAKFFATIELETEKQAIVKALYSNGSTNILSRFFGSNSQTIVKLDTIGYYYPVSDLDSFVMKFYDVSNTQLYEDTLRIKYPKNKEWIRTNRFTLSTNPYPLDEFSKQIFEYIYDGGQPFDGFYYFSQSSYMQSSYKNQFSNPEYKLWHAPIKEVYLKIIGEFTFSSIGKDGENNKSIIINKYKIEKSEVSDIAGITNIKNNRFYIQDKYKHCNIQSIPSKIIYFNHNFNKDTIINADSIIFRGNVTSSPNVTVILYANTFIEFPNSSISPSIVRDPFGNPKCKSEVVMDPNKINSFCSSFDYKAKNFSLKSSKYEPKELLKFKTNLLQSLSLHPNPASSVAKLTLTNYQNSNVNIKIFDLMGREMLEVVEKDITNREHNVDLDIERLAPGTYIVKVNNGFDEKATKLVVVRH